MGKTLGWTLGALAGTLLLGYLVYRGFKRLLPTRLISLEAKDTEQAKQYLETMAAEENCIIAIAVPAKKEIASVN